jgi:hypothetical protein
VGEHADPVQGISAASDARVNLDLLHGDALLHTDFNPLNVLLGLDRVWIIGRR